MTSTRSVAGSIVAASLPASATSAADQGDGIEPENPLVRAGSGRRRALLPGLDLLNHKPHAKTRLERAASDGGGTCWRVISEDTYLAGQQCFLTYGDRDNLKFLLQYGFALADNADALVLFDVRDLIGGCEAALPHVFTAVREPLLQQLSQHGKPTRPRVSSHVCVGSFDQAQSQRISWSSSSSSGARLGG